MRHLRKWIPEFIEQFIDYDFNNDYLVNLYLVEIQASYNNAKPDIITESKFKQMKEFKNTDKYEITRDNSTNMPYGKYYIWSEVHDDQKLTGYIKKTIHVTELYYKETGKYFMPSRFLSEFSRTRIYDIDDNILDNPKYEKYNLVSYYNLENQIVEYLDPRFDLD
jgi:hypothetical protein